ncbi:NAD(P)-dependent dehydrogenase (short-subunit alcohol dehydrogenase family) [Stella humosa]|uniref:NAD(P)-dependent dehydrogenase (Short-subunit alcohol dehydrogenase family) n=1 Tax=Stella humosa TaxID=94 RepID=A0A3N1L0Z8_9PROT|nr:SDR family NAD(P)-dependent oxidoreductase [Stella humosa]ROP84278.1 NAD(P)-dependent dehydrogenase (short-subunit alcohol dehydrogenase family) [Stella humosa]
MKIDGVAAIVTGGGSGLGAATARMLAAAGARVTVVDVKAGPAEQVAGEIGGLAVAADVTSAEAGAAAVAAGRERHGAARILVNCAGIAPAQRIVGRDGAVALDDFRRVIEVNLIGTFNMMRLVAADMQGLEALADGERGVIVSTASVAAFEGQIGQAAYAASKGGVVALTMPAAREFARSGIRVNAIAPGLFATPMLLGMPQAVQDSLAASVPFPSRFGTPEEYASLARHIVENTMINGECIRLDGAIRMQPR